MLVDRRRPDQRKIFEWASRLTSRGLSLIVFPEGTRSADGIVAPFKRGSFSLALDAGLAVVPLAIAGSRRVMAKGRLMTCPGRVRLTVLDPIETGQGSPVHGMDARLFAAQVRQTVAAALEQDPLNV